MVLRGLDLEVGSLKESVAFRALNRKNLIEYMKVQTIVQAIGYGAAVIANVSQGEQAPSPDNVNKILDSLKVLMLPSTKDELDRQSKRAKELMEHEASRGAFKVVSMSHEKRGKGLN